MPEPPRELRMGMPSQLPAQPSCWLSHLLCAIPHPSRAISSVKTCLLLLYINLLGITFRFSLASPCPSPSFSSHPCSLAALGPRGSPKCTGWRCMGAALQPRAQGGPCQHLLALRDAPGAASSPCGGVGGWMLDAPCQGSGVGSSCCRNIPLPPSPPANERR